MSIKAPKLIQLLEVENGISKTLIKALLRVQLEKTRQIPRKSKKF